MANPFLENTTENPRTKNIVFSKTFNLFATKFTVPLFFWSSVMVVPEIYAKNAGITGNMHGARNDPKPDNAAIAIVTSDMIQYFQFFY